MNKPQSGTKTLSAFIIFTDIKGFSGLSDGQLRAYHQELLPRLSDDLQAYIPWSESAQNKYSSVLVWNTWGDSLIAVVKDAAIAAQLMLDYRDFFLRTPFEKYGLPKSLEVRISGHYGEVDVFADPMLPGRNNTMGRNVHIAARLEPVAMPKDIYVTQQFSEKFDTAMQAHLEIEFDEVGEVELAKSYGSREVFVLRKASEKPKILYKILKQDLSDMLPDPEPLSSDETERFEKIMQYNHAELEEFCEQYFQLDDFKQQNGDKFFIQLSELLKDRGLYSQALRAITILENDKVTQVDGINMKLGACQPEVIKTKVNCLTRLGQYDKAANHIYGLWKSGKQGVDELSMLAAQYKRRVVYGHVFDNELAERELAERESTNNKPIEEGKAVKAQPKHKSEIDQPLLDRALSLYIEAWRLNRYAFYPAVNLMYLYSFSIGAKRKRAETLATYIQDYWSENTTKNWWLESSLLQTNLFLDLEGLSDKFANAIKEYQPSKFDLDTTREQIEIYAQVTGEGCEEVMKIIDVLRVNE